MNTEVYKFGGASLATNELVLNVRDLIQGCKAPRLVVVVSAKGLTTRKFEAIYLQIVNESDYQNDLNGLIKEHVDLATTLLDSNKEYELFAEQIRNSIERQTKNVNKVSSIFLYDQIVSQGELLSSYLLYLVVKAERKEAVFLRSKELVLTDHNYREAKVDFKETTKRINNAIDKDAGIYITQGFLGGTKEGFLTTLAKEGSDFSAAIYATALKAKLVTIWKDVKGVFNGDPKLFPKAQCIEQLNYLEAKEMTYHGAKVIHPKTIGPLERANIPLRVRSFLHKNDTGTLISRVERNENPLPKYILNKHQALIILSKKNRQFVMKSNLNAIFDEFETKGLQINMSQNSALNFYLIIDDKPYLYQPIIEHLESQFFVRVRRKLELFTLIDVPFEEYLTLCSKNVNCLSQSIDRVYHIAALSLRIS